MIGNVQILLQRTPFDRVSSYFAENYTYTPGNMLATYTDGTVTQENLYTGEGQRIQKKEDSDVTNYFYQFGSVLYTTDASGNLKAFNLLNISDAFGIERKSGTSETYYLYTEDLKGSTVNVLDNSAAAVVSYWYDDFGEVTESKASGCSGFDNELQYTGAVYDASTGLLYLNARFYDPQTGRFISRDTYRGEQNDPKTWHLYLYCANNPVNYVDPSGHAIDMVLDVLSIGWSAHDFARDPSWINAGYLAWDIGAACLPFVPGSYTVKGVTKANKIKKIGTKVPTTLNEIKKQKYLTVGKYSALKILFKGATRRSKIELHHIIEKRFEPAFDISANKFPAVAISKTVHREITANFKKAYDYNYGRKVDYYRRLSRGDLERIVDKVYLSMPALHKMAMLQVKYHIKNKSPLALYVKW